MSKNNQRVVITGIGVILPNALNLTDFWTNMRDGISQIDYITRFPTDNFPIKVAAELKNFNYKDFMPDLDEKRASHYNREILSLMSALESARKDARLEKDTIPPDRVGLVDSSSRCSIAWWDEMYKKYNETKDLSMFDRYTVLQSMASNPVTLAAINSNIQGFVTNLSAACVGGHHAISLCYQAVRKGRSDVMYASGHDFTILQPVMSMYSDPIGRVMSLEKENPKAAIKPYDIKRDGFILGEGAVALCIEKLDHALARGANIYAELLGHLSYNEADHAMRMDLTGKKSSAGIRKLIRISDKSLDDVDYVCAHGTATHNNDLAESRTMELLYSHKPKSKWPPLSSIKPIYGHTFGAAGIINVAATALMIKNKTICPTINLTDPDPQCDFDHVAEGARKVDKLQFAISMAFSIGSQSSFVSLGALD
ncbi:MAG: beta-ketoacyl-[acyl-carrier-protein] synthase family protein [Leptospiraceae bacterium]|nr:beta-ketoacyl-[acyl-carrier-protein] synthase family protein [Leptospiraceae bacterium]MCP5497382.1 beta-ketoacyl-[acyl-carrier-protein] synthase family protein [Leptospiraceae bacterium]